MWDVIKSHTYIHTFKTRLKHLWHDSFQCDTTHSNVGRDPKSYIRTFVTRLMHLWHDSSKCGTWLRISDLLWHDSFDGMSHQNGVTRYIILFTYIYISFKYIIFWHVSYYSHISYDSLIYISFTYVISFTYIILFTYIVLFTYIHIVHIYHIIHMYHIIHTYTYHSKTSYHSHIIRLYIIQTLFLLTFFSDHSQHNTSYHSHAYIISFTYIICEFTHHSTTAHCIWSVNSCFSNRNEWFSALGLFCRNKWYSALGLFCRNEWFSALGLFCRNKWYSALGLFCRNEWWSSALSQWLLWMI